MLISVSLQMFLSSLGDFLDWDASFVEKRNDDVLVGVEGH
jgi:hypothetical protein